MQKIDFVNSQQPAINDTNLNLMQTYIETAIQGAVSGDTLPIGSIMPFGGGTVPDNYLLCNGQAVSRTTYAQLFSIIGTAHGVGDGSTTFNVPDMRGRTIVGYDSTQTEFNSLGKTGGEKTHTLTINEMPEHRHTITPRNNSATGIYELKATNATGDIGSTYTGYSGGGQAHNNLQPYNTANYIIKAFQSAGVVANVLNDYGTSTSNVYSAHYMNSEFLKTYAVDVTLGTFPAGGDKHDQTYTITTTDIPSGYTPIAIIGTQLWGGYHSKVSFSYIYLTGTGNRTIGWAANNNSSSATGSIGSSIKILAIKSA